MSEIKDMLQYRQNKYAASFVKPLASEIVINHKITTPVRRNMWAKQNI